MESSYTYGMEQAISTDSKVVIITKSNVEKMTPVIQAPQVTRQPSVTQFSFFDLQNDAHIAQLCQRLEVIEQNKSDR